MSSMARPGPRKLKDAAARALRGGNHQKALAAYLALNTLGNVTSKSRTERLVMGSVSVLLVILTVLVAWQGDGPA